MRKLITLFIVLVTSCNGQTSTENFLLKPQAFHEKFTSSPGGMLIDVRSLGEVRQERLKGAMNFDFNMPEFDILIAGLDKTKPYFVYCASGIRSAKAAEKMRKIDIEKVYLLDGGLKAWKEDGLPTQAASDLKP